MTADPRKKPTTSELDRPVKAKVRKYIDSKKESEVYRPKNPGTDIFNLSEHDHNDDHRYLEEEYLEGHDQNKRANNRLVSAQDHRAFLSKNQQALLSSNNKVSN